MPTYEYVCLKCDAQFEFGQSMADEPLKVCPKERCRLKKWGKGKVKRAISSGAGLLFKGSGFYTTDYRSANYHESAKKDVAPSATPTKTESKPESKTSSDSKPAATKSK